LRIFRRCARRTVRQVRNLKIPRNDQDKWVNRPHCPQCTHNVMFDTIRLGFTLKFPLNAGGNGSSVSEWPNGGLVQIKKEPVSSSGGSSTPCLQVAEVTTSIRPQHQHQQQQNAVSTLSSVVAPPSMAAIVKLEAAPCPTSPCNGGVNSATANGGSKSMQHPSINSSGELNPHSQCMN